MYLFIFVFVVITGVALVGFTVFYNPDFVFRLNSSLTTAIRSNRIKPAETAEAVHDLGDVKHARRSTKRRLMLMISLLGGSVVFAIFMAAYFAASLWPAAPHIQDIPYTGNARLALSKESLIPPPPLPPSIFIGTERGNLETADRDWNKLEPAFRQTLLEIFARMEARGYPLALVEGYRSPDRQDQLAQGEQKITNARAFHSMHQFGLAADVAPIRNGKLAFSLGDAWTKAAYLALGEEASSSKLIWGGAWALQDYGHIQSRKKK